MNKFYKQLLDVLARKASLLSRFIDLLRREWKCVSDYSLEKLEEIVREKEELIARIQLLDVERESIVTNFAEAVGQPAEEVTLRLIARRKDNPWGKQMIARRDQLMGQVETINKLNRANRDLIDHSSLTMKKSMAFLYQADQDDQAGYYSNGQAKKEKMGSRMLSMDV
jgi:flagellar biosynthesis/type III secretory pathway chaperone